MGIASGKRALGGPAGCALALALCVVLAAGCGLGRSKSETLRDNLIALMDRYGDTMESITDARTAQAARPAIKQIIEENNALMAQIKEAASRMTPEEKEAFGASLAPAFRALKERLAPVHERLQNDREVEKVFKDIDMRRLFH